MSDCVCGARGIGLDGHECIPSLRARAEQAEKQLAEVRAELNRVQANYEGVVEAKNSLSLEYLKLQQELRNEKEMHLQDGTAAVSNSWLDAELAAKDAEIADKKAQLAEERLVHDDELAAKDARIRALTEDLCRLDPSYRL